MPTVKFQKKNRLGLNNKHYKQRMTGKQVNRFYTPVKDIPKIVQGVKEAFATGKTKSANWRKKQLRGLHAFLDKEESHLTDALSKDMGKHPQESVLLDINVCKSSIAAILLNLEEWMEPEVVQPSQLAFVCDRVETRLTPFGTALVIGTWNYPVVLSLDPVAFALAAGNAVVLKLSEVASSTSEVIQQRLPKYLDPDAFKIVYGDVPQTTALLEEHFNFIFYTGNPTVARIVMKAASKHLTPVALELGGKSPVIIDKDADAYTAALRVVWGKCVNAGQTCIAPDHVFVHKDIAKRFYDAIPVAVDTLYGKEGTHSKFYPRIINRRHFDRLKGILDGQMSVPGTQVVYGGETDEKDCFIAFTVLSGITTDGENPAMKGEIFGPVLPVIEYEDINEVIKTIQAKQEPSLNLYPFSRNNGFIEKVLGNVDSGNAVSNDVMMNFALFDIPFGGVGESGMGQYHGKAGFQCFSQRRAVVKRPAGLEIVNYPRYQQLAYNSKSIFNKLIRLAMVTPLRPEWYIHLRYKVRKLVSLLKGRLFGVLLFAAFLIGRNSI